MMSRRIAVLLAAAALIAACQQTRVIAVGETFDPKAAAAALAPGDNTIRGSAFSRKLSSTIVPAAGEVVRLVPANAYSDARIKAFYGDSKMADGTKRVDFADTHPEYVALTRTTKADKKGDFEFERVRPGRYYLITRVFWTERGVFNGLHIYDEVTVRGSGQTVDVILSGN